MKNLFENIPTDLPEEHFQALVHSDSVRIERIVSRGHVSPVKGWYDPDDNEFVLILEGAACLEFADGRRREMGPGDWLVIPAHEKHRVAWTDPERDTVWLAVHYRAP